MGRAEQGEEREVLASIFPDEITDTSDNSYTILVPLDLDLDSFSSEKQDDTDSPILNILLSVSYPEAYPDVAPDLSVSHPPGKPSLIPRTLLSFPDDAATLLSQLEEPINDSLGAAMIFTLHSALKEGAEALIQSRIAAAQEEKDAEARRAEEAENAKFAGEKVTKERFLEWRDKFRRDMAEKEEREEAERRKADEMTAAGRKARAAATAGGVGEEGKLTGKQLWERGLVSGKGEDDDLDAGKDDSVDKDDVAAKLDKVELEGPWK